VRSLLSEAKGIQPPAGRAAHALKLPRSERPSERQRRPCPSKADWCTGDVGAPTGAVHIDKLIWWVKIPLEHNGRPTASLK